MRLWLRTSIDAVRTSLWFVPALLVLLATGLAFGLMHLDRQMDRQQISAIPWIFGAGTDGAREVLAAIASSMMTVTGITFSATLVALTLASQQYSPRVLRQFTSDRSNQVVLGTFIATFVYCLLVLRSVRSEDFGSFVPHLAVTGSVLLAVGSVALLIYFIHHVTVIIRPSTIVQGVTSETCRLIERLFPEPIGNGAGEAELPADLPRCDYQHECQIRSRHAGYVQSLDADRLIQLAREVDLMLRIEVGIGDFVDSAEPVVTVWSRGILPDNLHRCIRRCFVAGPERNMQEDGVRSRPDCGCCGAGTLAGHQRPHYRPYLHRPTGGNPQPTRLALHSTMCAQE